jgi:SAM-dependent methyltransferase
MLKTQNSTFEALIREALSLPFSGWDFSLMHDRWEQQEPTWDYAALARQRMAGVTRLLDQDTGGGELLASLAPLPPFTSATESYPPNIPVARARLKQMGVYLISQYRDDTLPVGDDSLDLVLNRHGSFSAPELRRILHPGGIFLTQQVGGKENLRLNELLQDDITYSFMDWTLEVIITQLQHAGLDILQAQECFPENIFRYIGAVVFYLRIISWQIADFTVEKYRDRLFNIHEQIQRDGGLVTHSHRILVEARKPD